MADSTRLQLDCGVVCSTCINFARVSRRRGMTKIEGPKTANECRNSPCSNKNRFDLSSRHVVREQYMHVRNQSFVGLHTSVNEDFCCELTKIKNISPCTLSTRKCTLNSFLRSTLTLVMLLFVLVAILTEGVPVSEKRTGGKRRKALELDSNRNISYSANPNIETELTPTVNFPLSGFIDANAHAQMRIDDITHKSKRGAGRKRSKKGRRNRKNKKAKRRNKGRRKNKRRKNKRRNKKSKERNITREKIHGMPSQETMAVPTYQRLYVDIGNSFHLAITAKGKVVGEVAYKRSNYSVLEMKSFERVERKKIFGVAIVGVATSRYICVTKRGAVKARKTYNKNRCLFNETVLQNNQNLYESLSCKGCYLHITKKGRIKNLRGTNKNDKIAHFLPHDRSSISRPRRRALTRGKLTTVDVTNMTTVPVNSNPTMSSVIAEIPSTEIHEPKHGKRSRQHKSGAARRLKHGAGSTHRAGKTTRQSRVYDATNR